MKLETVCIEHKDGFCVINESDFDAKKHTLYVATEKAPEYPEGYEVESGGGGNWKVFFNGKEVAKGKGKAKLASFFAELE